MSPLLKDEHFLNAVKTSNENFRKDGMEVKFGGRGKTTELKRYASKVWNWEEWMEHMCRKSGSIEMQPPMGEQSRHLLFS